MAARLNRKTLAVAAALPVLMIAVLLWCRAGETRPAKRDAAHLKGLDADIEKLRPLHTKMGKPRPGDWLDRHKETGQTFNQYVIGEPVMPRGRRKVIYVQPLGSFNKKQREVVDLTAEFMRIYFNLEVKIRKDLPLTLIPAKARRVHPQMGMKQILAGYVLDDVLKPRLPRDAAAYIAFTTSDLWPGRGWNYVFGMASLRERVGVWSIYRNGDPAKGEKAFRLCLLRTMKTATHETGHMFSMKHCTKYECNMCGSNHRAEADRRPIFCCPECVAKISWACQADLVERYRKLAKFFQKQGYKEEVKFCEKSIKALGGKVRAKKPAAEKKNAG